MKNYLPSEHTVKSWQMFSHHLGLLLFCWFYRVTAQCCSLQVTINKEVYFFLQQAPPTPQKDMVHLCHHHILHLDSSCQGRLLGPVAQLIMCLTTDAYLTADPVVSILWSHNLAEIDHEIISTVILLSSTDLFKKGCCQLQVKVCG